MAIEEFEFGIYPDRKLSSVEAAVWIRDALQKAGLAQSGLVPMVHAAEWWKNADPLIVAGGAVLTNKKFAEESEDPGWAMRIFYLETGDVEGVSGYVPPWPFDSKGKSVTWQWLTQLLERLAPAADADVVFVNGSGDGDEKKERLPTEQEIGAGLPRAITAWNYFSAKRLTDGLRDGLKELPAFESKPLGNGWVLRPVNDFEEKLPSGFLTAYGKLAGGKALYLRGSLE